MSVGAHGLSAGVHGLSVGVQGLSVGGEYGTLSEIGLALKFGLPVVGLDTWELRRGGIADASILRATDPVGAVNLLLKSISR